MVTLPVPTDAAVAVTEQLPATSVHDGAENVTVPVPGVPCVKDTVPVGLEPVTVAVQVLVLGEPETLTLEGTQLTAVEDAIKFPVSLIGAFIVTDDGLVDPVKLPLPTPVQLKNAWPPLGVAVIGTTAAAF